MGTDIKLLLEQDYGYCFSLKDEQRIKIPSLVYGHELQHYSTKRRSFYVNFFEKLKRDLSDILNISESDYKKGSKKLVSEYSKESIAMAMLAMRGQLIKEAQYDNMEKVYKMGYDIPSKIFNEEISEEERSNERRIIQIKDDFDNDIDRFIGDLADNVDDIIDRYEFKSKNNSEWTWAALMVAVFGGVSALEYRLRLISIEPFRLAYRYGALDGVNKVLEKKGLKVQRYLWEATGADPCDECTALDGTEVSWEKVQQFAHPNCQCTITLIVG